MLLECNVVGVLMLECDVVGVLMLVCDVGLLKCNDNVGCRTKRSYLLHDTHAVSKPVACNQLRCLQAQDKWLMMLKLFRNLVCYAHSDR